MLTFLTPVHILTGFLGSGKTTLLNKLLNLPSCEGTLVIVNEFGETSVDHHLVEESTETVFELSNGCLCCSMRGELVDTLAAINLDSVNRVIIETTGIADPMPVFQSLSVPLLQGRGLYPANILAVYDTIRGEELINENPDAKRQLALADTVFLSRTDINPDFGHAKDAVNRINPAANCVSDPKHIILDRPFDAEHQNSLKSRFSDETQSSHKVDYTSLVLESLTRQPLPVFAGFLHHLANRLGPRLLRAKGFGFCAESEFPVLLQMSGQILHEPVPLDKWPDGLEKTRIVVIGTDINAEEIRSLFNSFFDVAAVDTPDREALTNNPLAISGT